MPYNPYKEGTPAFRVMENYIKELAEYPLCTDPKHPGCDQCQPSDEPDINPDDEDDNYGT